jgi:hypothetical protein
MKSVNQACIFAIQVICTCAVAVIASNAMAQEATVFDHNAQPTTLSRAEVNAEIAKARADGTLNAGDDAFVVAVSAQPASRTRAEVVAEVIKARADGTLNPGEDAFLISINTHQSALVSVAVNGL